MRTIIFTGFLFCCLIGCKQSTNSNGKIQESLSVDSLFNLGMAYLYEDTDKPKFDSAEYYLEQAALLNNSLALRVLGGEYLSGSRLERDKQKGLLYLEKAIALGDISSYYFLAEYYYPNNMKKVKELLEQGMSKGDKYAPYELYMLYYNGYAFGRSEYKNEKFVDEKKGIEYLLKADEMGSFDAQLSLVYLYANGREGIVAPNKEKALFYLEKAENNPELKEIPAAIDELEMAKKSLKLK